MPRMHALALVVLAAVFAASCTFDDTTIEVSYEQMHDAADVLAVYAWQYVRAGTSRCEPYSHALRMRSAGLTLLPSVCDTLVIVDAWGRRVVCACSYAGTTAPEPILALAHDLLHLMANCEVYDVSMQQVDLQGRASIHELFPVFDAAVDIYMHPEDHPGLDLGIDRDDLHKDETDE